MNNNQQRLLILLFSLAFASEPNVRVGLAQPAARESTTATHQANSVQAGNIRPRQRQPVKPKIEGHWGEDAVGFRWEEADSVDGRWNQSNIGTFLASVVHTPTGAVAKGLSIKIGEKSLGTVCYDLSTMTPRAGWLNGFLTFNPARYGIISAPKIDGTVCYSDGGPAWGDARVRYLGLSAHSDRVVLSYTVDGVRFDESPWLAVENNRYDLYRRFRVARCKERIQLRCGQAGAKHSIVPIAGAQLSQSARNAAELFIEPHEQPIEFVIVHRCPVTTDQTVPDSDLPAAAVGKSKSQSITKWMQPGPLVWPHVVETQGSLGPDDAAYVVDTITIPFDNPYKALMFLGGFDFFSDGRLAVCTLHGDVWIVDGVDDGLRHVTWKRFATGLHQPLGLRIVRDTVYVLGRDQITRLFDRDDNGEADYYENFNNDGKTSIGGHDYATGLETDSRGNFYYVRAGSGLIRVSADGKKHESIAAGWRNPNGISIGPHDEITIAPQEGEWTPASAVYEVKPGGWYGFGGPRVTDDRPLGYDPPLCWIPRLVDNSTGGQVWVTSDRWGPLDGQLINTSFGRCRLLLTLREQIDGVAQGGSVKMGLEFRSGVMRARFSPRDGQLYVAGLKGWASSAVDDGGLHRIRYTGRPCYLPDRLNVYQNGLLVRFTEPLDPASVADVDNFHVQQWNYKYRSQYGSPEYKVSQPNQEGRDEVDVQSVSLLQGGRAVFLEILDLRPVMQMQIGYTLRAADGQPVRGNVYNTINVVPSRSIRPTPIGLRVTDFDLTEDERAHLQRGLVARFTQFGVVDTITDARVSRLAAFHKPTGASPTPLLEPDAFRLLVDGWLHVLEKDTYRFSVRGSATPRLSIDGQQLPWQPPDDFTPARSVSNAIELRRGYHKIQLAGHHAAGDEVNWRLYWQADRFATEPVPPTAFFHNGRDTLLADATQMRRGRELFATRGCFRCHALRRPPSVDSAMPELASTGPNLRGIGSRVNQAWLHHWLINPHTIRSDARMPILFHPDVAADHVQRVADVAAYLASLTPPAEGANTQADEARSSGETRVGAELFETMGCIACHCFAIPDANDPYDRLSLYYVGAKFRPGELVEFLLMPHRYYAWSRMPDFRLDDLEASHLAAFLRKRATGELPGTPSIPDGDAERGRGLFLERGCANCHATEYNGVPAAPPFDTVIGAPPLRGCLASDVGSRGRAPDFGLTTEELAALTSFLRSDGKSLARHSLTEAAARAMTDLLCLRCHRRDGSTGVWTEILDEESEFGQAPEPIPELTWTGEKLRHHWTDALLAGRTNQRTRPWLQARMPAFPAYAAVIATGLAEQHAVADTEPSTGPADMDLAAIGLNLTKKDIGFDCRQCHALGEQYLDLRNKSNGPAFSIITARLRREFYDRWMMDPLRVDPLTKMTRFTEDRMTTRIQTPFDGDARKQFDAVWHYFRSIEGYTVEDSHQ